MSSRVRYAVFTAVWGDELTRLMADVTLPASLAPGNLPALSRLADVTLHIYCPSRAERALRASAIFPKLASSVAVEFHEIASEASQAPEASSPAEHASALLGDCRRRAVEAARQREEALVVLPPDVIWSDGSLLRMHELAQDGARAVMVAAPRADKAAFLRALESEAPGPTGSDDRRLENRLLMRLLLDNLHSHSEELVWREDQLASCPSQLLWRVGERDLLMRAFQLHSLLLRPTHARPRARGGEAAAGAMRGDSEIHLVRDSDEIAACKLTTTIASVAGRATPNLQSGTRRVAAWMKRSTNSLQRRCVRDEIRLHAEEIDRTREYLWTSARERSDWVLARIERDYLRLQRSSSSSSSSAAGAASFEPGTAGHAL